jgi:hypothetical protein
MPTAFAVLFRISAERCRCVDLVGRRAASRIGRIDRGERHFQGVFSGC